MPRPITMSGCDTVYISAAPGSALFMNSIRFAQDLPIMEEQLCEVVLTVCSRLQQGSKTPVLCPTATKWLSLLLTQTFSLFTQDLPTR